MHPESHYYIITNKESYEIDFMIRASLIEDE